MAVYDTNLNRMFYFINLIKEKFNMEFIDAKVLIKDEINNIILHMQRYKWEGKEIFFIIPEKIPSPIVPLIPTTPPVVSKKKVTI